MKEGWKDGWKKDKEGLKEGLKEDSLYRRRTVHEQSWGGGGASSR